jgi:hypothetical protein
MERYIMVWYGSCKTRKKGSQNGSLFRAKLYIERLGEAYLEGSRSLKYTWDTMDPFKYKPLDCLHALFPS